MTTQTAPGPVTPADREDERLRTRPAGARGQLAGALDALRGGELGLLPVVVGLVVIAVVFQSLNSLFLSSGNLVNLTLQCSSNGVIALGIVAVLLVGQIDLSVGAVSGGASAMLGVFFVTHHWSLVPALLVAVLLGSAAGAVYSVLFLGFGIPTFVATLAGLLAFSGVQLQLLGATGSINIPFNSSVVRFAQLDFLPHWLAYALVVGAAVGLLASGLSLARRRRAAGLTGRSTTVLVARSLALLVGGGVVVTYLDRNRGVGWMPVVFLGLTLALHYALTRTRWGRSVYAVGGSVEAARRAGINTRAVFASTLVLCSSLAAVGGIFAAAYLGAANEGTGTGDTNLTAIAAAVIGGASLFGGRGTAWAAPLGILVIQGIQSGLNLLNYGTAIRYEVTALALALAVGVDALSRRSRSSHGKA